MNHLLKKTLLCTALFLMTNCTVFRAWAQAPAIQWQKALGGSGYDVAYDVKATKDGGYIMVGYTTSNDGDVSGGKGNYDYWVVKVNSSGAIQWQKTYGGSIDEYATAVQQTADGGYIVTGHVRSLDGDVTGYRNAYDYWVLKLNSGGELQWQKALGGTFSDMSYAIQQTTDGGYIVAGYVYSNDGDVTGSHGNGDCWLVKLSSSGTIQWQKAYGGSGEDRAFSVQQTTDGGYIMAGSSRSNDGDVTGNHGDMDYWVVKLNGSGVLQWQKSLGGTGSETANTVRQTADGGYIVAGYAESVNGDVTGNKGQSDYWLVKLSGSGSLQWQKTYGGRHYDMARSVRQTPDGGYIIAGYSSSDNGDITNPRGNQDYWVVKINSGGTLQWQKAMGGHLTDDPIVVEPTADGGYIVAGMSESPGGDVTGNHGWYEAWLVKLAPDPVLPVVFTGLQASVSEGQLRVDWETASEQNCSHYRVEVSADGNTFKHAGTVDSKAIQGSSNRPLSYTFTTATGAAALGVLALCPLLMGAWGRRRRVLVALALTGACFVVACNKRRAATVETGRPLFVRIIQVDKDGQQYTSKTVRAVKQ
ncbi:hypothetical protein LL912_19760 [Niabella sp. CC-SYL272]|uniref:hypothetical protein n=1 Tax=Niabella agricola TaxID=2891571 RepID=UPI001F3A88F4|nr:hypothetical protein [Niabella agricola]MCF3111033.1 hypothetical protein [Niabella agricola]